MPRGPQKWTEALIKKRIKEGYGQGEGKQYKGWIQVADFSSMGLVSRIFSPRYERTFHVFSQGEEHTFYLLERANNVTNIYDQYPLDRDITMQISEDLSIKHPYYPHTDVPCVLTVDFLATLSTPDGPHLLPISCKNRTGIEDERELIKHEIVRIYFQGMDAKLRFSITEILPSQKVKNLIWIRKGCQAEGESEPYTGYFKEHMGRMLNDLYKMPRDKTLEEYCSNFDKRFSLESGNGLRIAKMLLYERALRVDLALPDLATAPLAVFIF